MKFLRVLKHIGITAAGVILVLGVPLWATGYITSLFSPQADAVSSASTVLPSPSGDYVILINRDLHTDEENLKKWIVYFNGDTSQIIFEDVGASAAASDSAGIEMAESIRSKLGENQMEVTVEDSTLMLSRAENGKFDIIIMSKEFADAYGALRALGSSALVIETSGLGEEADG